MFSDTIRQALNEQISVEFNAAYSYLGMATWCERQAFSGAAKWLRMQYEEEIGHGMKLYNFLLARDCEVELGQIDKPTIRFDSLLHVFATALEQEVAVSERLERLYQQAFEERAYTTLVELQWFLAEQVEEEKTIREIVKKLQLVKDDPSALLEIDRMLGERPNVAL
ncbi:MAG: ferritin [Pirellulaceae bacterium]|nr:MAG: ferritin [Pirellulaceae bacterium]